MSFSFDSRNYNKYVDVKIEVDGITHDLGFQDEVAANELLASLREAVSDIESSIHANVYMDDYQ